MTSKMKELIDLGLVVGDEIVYKHGSGKRTDKITRIEWRHTEYFYLSPYMIGDIVLRMDNIDIEATRQNAEKNFDEMVETLYEKQLNLRKIARKISEAILHDFKNFLEEWCPYYNLYDWVSVFQQAILDNTIIVLEVYDSFEEDRLFQSFASCINRVGTKTRIIKEQDSFDLSDPRYTIIPFRKKS